jgi:hypothetical protein
VVQVCGSVWNGRSLSLCEEVRISYGSVTTSVRWHLHCFLLLGAKGGNFYAAGVWEVWHILVLQVGYDTMLHTFYWSWYLMATFSHVLRPFYHYYNCCLSHCTNKVLFFLFSFNTVPDIWYANPIYIRARKSDD